MSVTQSAPTPATIAKSTAPVGLAADRELTALDRCDGPACGAQAYAVASFLSDTKDVITELTFCGHHFKEYRPRLEAQGAVLTDHTDQIAA